VAQAESFRSLVEARASGACEYCRLLQVACGVTFHIEHLLPRSRDGATTLDNLAFSCPGCNLAKSDQLTGQDSLGRPQRLFNPRDYDPASLGWHLHFILDRETGVIVPRTDEGDATIRTLRMNDPIRVFARRLQVESGLIS
jgi:HNH endonuclease